MFIAPSHRYSQRCASAAERCAGHDHPWSTAGVAMGASAKTRLARHHQARCSTGRRILSASSTRSPQTSLPPALAEVEESGEGVPGLFGNWSRISPGPIAFLRDGSPARRAIGPGAHLRRRGAAPGGGIGQLGAWGGPMPSFAARIAPRGRLRPRAGSARRERAEEAGGRRLRPHAGRPGRARSAKAHGDVGCVR